MDKLMVITSENFIPNEAQILISLFENGLEYLHLRKPSGSIDEVKTLLAQIPEKYLNRISLHDYFALAQEFAVGGIHLNSRNPSAPPHFQKRISCSCHSLQELALKKQHDHYAFLSPIFNSLSKKGYTAHFSEEELKEAGRQKIIDFKTIALGGIEPDKFQQLTCWGFGGCALLGYLWDKNRNSIEEYVNLFLHAKNLFNRLPEVSTL